MKMVLFPIACVAVIAACSDKPAETKAPVAMPVGASAAPSSNPIVPTDIRPAQISTTLAPTDQCSVDSFNGAAAAALIPVSHAVPVVLNGWAAHVSSGSLPKLVYLELRGPNVRYAQAVVGGDRLDVAEYFKKPSLAKAGWDVQMGIVGLAPGNYGLHVIQVHADNTATICDAHKSLVVAPGVQ